MADSSQQSITIPASPPTIAAVIADFASYPEWVDAVKSAEVVSEYEDGYAHQAHFVLDAGVVKDDYTLEYAYAEDLTRIEWTLVRSTMMKLQNGSYDLVDNGDGTTTVTYTLEIELNVPMLGMFKRKAEKRIMDTALKDLKKRVESL
ncbi:SRPBCC family protein [Cryptosporangium phraense]|uniref:SRPBCC family protein n=1 Tax=Cryptosporangium phraense TaxID=2593070 RepID=A0A545ATA8_9ACTN|nr:SRPBCC family protein [Cryptosporangium phraense]TQS44579.1 SRPBCC family protein [Cryptosporangium phraense]